ncbi:MAG: FAD:protein FMN transferase, partial [Salinibacter sp.]
KDFFLRRVGRRGLAVVLLFLVSVFGRSVWGQSTLKRFEYRQTRMGMAVRVVLYAPSDSVARRAGTAAFRLMEDLESRLSSYRPSSELNRLPRRAESAPTVVSAPLFAVLRHAQRLARQSGGAFDVTAEPYFELWAQARRSGQLPDSSALQRAGARVGWRKVDLNPARRTVRLRADSMQLNLGGIAKGYILDRALDTLSDEGIDRAMIEAGGDLVMSGPPPNKDGWRIRLPGAGPDGEDRTLRLHDAAVSTSGDTEQFVEIGGTRYSHVIDPRTGIGLTHRLLVTVVAERGVVADGVATTISVLGAENGRAFLAEHYPSATAYIRPAPQATSPN